MIWCEAVLRQLFYLLGQAGARLSKKWKNEAAAEAALQASRQANCRAAAAREKLVLKQVHALGRIQPGLLQLGASWVGILRHRHEAACTFMMGDHFQRCRWQHC